MKNHLQLFALLVLLMITILVGFTAKQRDSTYYLPAELLSRDDANTFFTTEQGVYRMDSAYVRDDGEVPYLLCMDKNKTLFNKSDDNILVVWSTQ